ncbi:hypothetical protein FQZ97_733590 [compost metagenome]
MGEIPGDQLNGETSILDLRVGLFHFAIGARHIDEKLENGRHHQQAHSDCNHQLDQAESRLAE